MEKTARRKRRGESGAEKAEWAKRNGQSGTVKHVRDCRPNRTVGQTVL